MGGARIPWPLWCSAHAPSTAIATRSDEVNDMGFSNGGHVATASRPATHDRRHEHLAALQAAVQGRREMVAILVTQRGVSWVSIARCGDPHRAVDVVCDYCTGNWWSTSMADGAGATPVGNITGCIQAIIRAPGRP